MSIESHISRICSQAQLKFVDTEFGTSKHYSNASFTCSTSQQDDPDRLTARRYLVASITKPIVAMAILKLAAEGELSLSERIGKYAPAFARACYRRITVRHLLTHTSGFGDMVPTNVKLRQAHAPLADFLTAAASVEPEFAPGTDSRYSSIGYLILGEIIQQLTAMSSAEFLNRTIFQPLQMHNSWLGLPPASPDIAQPSVLPCQLPIWQPDTNNDWSWNSNYWLNLGAPWGGMISSAQDLGKFARMLLRGGTDEVGKQILPRQAVQAALANQLIPYFDETTFTGSRRGWGFGWRMQWPAHQASFGDFVSPQTAGHWGATGTLMWIDSSSQKYAVALTTTPYENSRTAIQQISNIAATT